MAAGSSLLDKLKGYEHKALGDARADKVDHFLKHLFKLSKRNHYILSCVQAVLVLVILGLTANQSAAWQHFAFTTGHSSNYNLGWRTVAAIVSVLALLVGFYAARARLFFLLIGTAGLNAVAGIMYGICWIIDSSVLGEFEEIYEQYEPTYEVGFVHRFTILMEVILIPSSLLLAAFDFFAWRNLHAKGKGATTPGMLRDVVGSSTATRT